MLLPEPSLVASSMARPLGTSQVLGLELPDVIATIGAENDIQTIRTGDSGNDQAFGLLESILLFFYVAAGCGGDRLRFQSHHRSELDPSEDSATPFAVFSRSVVHGLAGVFHLAELTGTDAQRADSPDDRMVWWGNGGADSSGGSGNCRDDGQIRQDAIENEQRRRRYDHPHVGHGGLHSRVCTGDLLEKETGVPSAADFDRDLRLDGGWLGTLSGVAAATGDFLCRRGFPDSTGCFSRLDNESESSSGLLIR